MTLDDTIDLLIDEIAKQTQAIWDEMEAKK